MTGVQTCALPICFPVTIRGSDDDDGEAAVGRGSSKSSSNSTQAIATSSANNVDKLEESPVQSAPVSRGSFRKNAAKAEATIPSGDL